jgi:ubiquinone/menaquinone biosynthesis C-methylase UbiE
MNNEREELILLPLEEYVGVDHDDPIRFYKSPVFGKYYRQRVEICLKRCKGGEKILEVGFGTGVTFLNLARKYNEIHGIDLKADTEKITNLFVSKGLQIFLKQGDLLNLPYENSSFDTVLLISILEHLKPVVLDKAFHEIKRVIKPGGQLVYGVPVDSNLTRMGFLILGYNIREHHFSNDCQIQSYARNHFQVNEVISLRIPVLRAKIYEIGDFTKQN